MLACPYFDRAAERSTPPVPFRRRLCAKGVSTGYSGSSVVDGKRVEGIRWQSTEAGRSPFEEAWIILSIYRILIGGYQT
jgi:hypothetical protein